MKIAIGADHRGYMLKGELAQALTSLGHEVEDVGTHSEESCDYPLFSRAVAERVAESSADLGIIICHSGVGSSMAANKVAGVRAALCHDLEGAELSRLHNDANVLVLGARETDATLAKSMVERWLQTEFEGGRHARRVGQMQQIEENNINNERTC